MTRTTIYKGFTLIELAVVLMIIGILTVITSVSYSAVQESSRNKEVSEEMAKFGRTMVKYKADNGAYPASTYVFTGEYGVSFTTSLYLSTTGSYNLFYCTKSPNSEYALLAVTNKGKRFFIKNGGSPEEYKGSTSWTGTNTSSICSSILSGTSSSGLVGWNNVWRPWVNGTP